MKVKDYLLSFEFPNTEIEDLMFAMSLFRIDIIELKCNEKYKQIHHLVDEIIKSPSYDLLTREELWDRLLKMEVDL